MKKNENNFSLEKTVTVGQNGKVSRAAFRPRAVVWRPAGQCVRWNSFTLKERKPGFINSLLYCRLVFNLRDCLSPNFSEFFSFRFMNRCLEYLALFVSEIFHRINGPS